MTKVVSVYFLILICNCTQSIHVIHCIFFWPCFSSQSSFELTKFITEPALSTALSLFVILKGFCACQYFYRKFYHPSTKHPLSIFVCAHLHSINLFLHQPATSSKLPGLCVYTYCRLTLTVACSMSTLSSLFDQTNQLSNHWAADLKPC